VIHREVLFQRALENMTVNPPMSNNKITAPEVRMFKESEELSENYATN
jgi:hypothetical protein